MPHPAPLSSTGLFRPRWTVSPLDERSPSLAAVALLGAGAPAGAHLEGERSSGETRGTYSTAAGQGLAWSTAGEFAFVPPSAALQHVASYVGQGFYMRKLDRAAEEPILALRRRAVQARHTYYKYMC